MKGLKQGRSPTRNKSQKNKERGTQLQNIDKNIINTALYSQPHQSVNKNIFYIKTLEVRDINGNPLKESTGPILIEQIFGDFDQVRLYDTSYVQMGQCLYFFRRHFHYADGDEGLYESKYQNMAEEMEASNMQNPHYQNSTLVLH